MTFSLIRPDDPDRDRVERAIRDTYASCYGAAVPRFAEVLATLFAPGRDVLCAAGIQRGGETPFFSEQYLDSAAEIAASERLSRPVGRDELLEISTLAATRGGAGARLIEHVVGRARRNDCSTLLFTATAPLRTYLRRHGVDVIEIARADPSRLADARCWGRYYETDPMVCLAPDSAARPFALPVRTGEAGIRVAA